MAQIVSEIGDWFYTLSIYTLLLQLTGRASSVALALVLQVLPQTLVGPTAGVVNDRLPQAGHDCRRPGALRSRARHAPGTFAFYGVAGLSAAAGGDHHGCVLRTGTQFGNP
jgi:hypothetical protein